jgi:hypothetical protein
VESLVGVHKNFRPLTIRLTTRRTIAPLIIPCHQSSKSCLDLPQCLLGLTLRLLGLTLENFEFSSCNHIVLTVTAAKDFAFISCVFHINKIKHALILTDVAKTYEEVGRCLLLGKIIRILKQKSNTLKSTSLENKNIRDNSLFNPKCPTMKRFGLYIGCKS